MSTEQNERVKSTWSLKKPRRRNPWEIIGEARIDKKTHVYFQFTFSFKNGQFKAAAEHYTRALANEPENAKTLSNRAACYQKLEQLDLCVEVRI